MTDAAAVPEAQAHRLYYLTPSSAGDYADWPLS